MSKPTSKTPLFKRVYLVDRELQLRYVKLAVLVGAGSTILTTFVILYPLFQFQILRFPNFLPTPFIAAILIAAAFNLVTVGFLAVLITHRVAGPMFSMVRHFRLLVQTRRFGGDLRIRDSDDLKYVVRNFNELMGCLRDLMQSDLAYLKSAAASLDAGDAATARQRIAELTASLEQRLERTPSPHLTPPVAPLGAQEAGHAEGATA